MRRNRDQIRLALTEAAAKQFNTTLKQYRAQQVSVQNLIQQVLELFSSNSADYLIPEFRGFISKKHHSLFDEIVGGRETLSAGSPEPAIALLDRGVDGTKRPPLVVEDSPANALACPVCKESIANGYRARCGHVCCLPCWCDWLQLKPECPSCGERTRMPQLKRVSAAD